MLSFSRSRSRNREEGFTLPELLIAIVIMGILLAIAIPVFTNVIKSGKITRLKSDVTTSALNLGVYYDRYGSYPGDASTSDTTFATSVAVVTKDSNDQIAFKNPNNQPAGNGLDSDVCVTGTLIDGSSTYQYSYNLAQKKLVSGGCTYVLGTLRVENPR